MQIKKVTTSIFLENLYEIKYKYTFYVYCISKKKFNLKYIKRFNKIIIYFQKKLKNLFTRNLKDKQ